MDGYIQYMGEWSILKKLAISGMSLQRPVSFISNLSPLKGSSENLITYRQATTSPRLTHMCSANVARLIGRPQVKPAWRGLVGCLGTGWGQGGSVSQDILDKVTKIDVICNLNGTVSISMYQSYRRNENESKI